MFLRSSSFSRAVVAFAMLVSVCALASAQNCTPETCPPGPVEAIFEHPNCTGSVTFRPVTDDEYGVCIVENQYNSRRYDEVEGGILYLTTNNPTCTTGLANETGHGGFWAYYLCSPYIPLKREDMKREKLLNFPGHILLPSVNATFSEGQNYHVSNSYPNINEYFVDEQCTEVNNCVRQGQTAQYYRNDNNITCDPQSSRGIFNVSYDGTCYRSDNIEYVSYRCLDEHTTALSRYVGEGCQYLTKTETERNICSDSSLYTAYCLAAPTNVPPTSNPAAPAAPTMPMAPTPSGTPSGEPKSDALSIVPTSLFIIASLAILFF